MPVVDLICIAVSNKMRGLCVAGLRTDGKGWVRPIAPDTDYGQFYSQHLRLDDGTAPAVLDVVGVDLLTPLSPELVPVPSSADPVSASLALVASPITQWYVRSDMKGRPQPRVLFELGGRYHDLPITNPAWMSRVIRKLSEMERVSYPQEAVGIPGDSKVLFTISLSEPLAGYCYKLIAGIVVLPPAMLLYRQ